MVRAESCRGLELACGEYGNAPEHRRDLHRPCRICFLDQQGWAWQKKCLEAPEICREASEDLQGQETWAQACTCQRQIHTYNAVQRRHSNRPPQKVQEYASAKWREVD